MICLYCWTKFEVFVGNIHQLLSWNLPTNFHPTFVKKCWTEILSAILTANASCQESNYVICNDITANESKFVSKQGTERVLG